MLLLDRAGWHTTDKLRVPRNITLIWLPSRSPELNPVVDRRAIRTPFWSGPLGADGGSGMN